MTRSPTANLKGGGGGVGILLSLDYTDRYRHMGVVFRPIWSGKGSTFCLRSLEKGTVLEKNL